MIPQFSLNLLFKHDQENLPGLLTELAKWCTEHQDTAIQFFDLGSHDDSRKIIEKWAASTQVRAAVKVVDVLDYSHFSQSVGLALQLSVGQVAWVGTPEAFPKVDELESIFGRWNDGAEIIWGFKPSSISSGFFDPLLRQVEATYPQSFADQFFEQDRGAFIVCDRKVMITHNAMLTSSSHWWRHVVAAGWSMDRWTLKNPVQTSTRVNAPHTRPLDVLVLWLNQGSRPLQQLVYAFLGFGALALVGGLCAFVLGVSGIEIHPLWNSLYLFGGFAITMQLLTTSFLFLVLARRWDRNQALEKPLRYQEHNLAEASPEVLRGHKPLAVQQPAEAVRTTEVARPAATITPIRQATNYHRPATIIAPEETNVAPTTPDEVPEPVAQAVVAPETPEETPAPLAPTQIPIMSINSKSS